MEIWYALTGLVDKREVQESIRWLNSELYSKPVDRLRFLIASSSGEIDAGINLHTYLKALPFEVETIGFGGVDVAATLVFLAGKNRIAIEGTEFLFHEGRYTVQDVTAPIHQHEDAITVFKRELHHMIYIIARETGNDTEVVAAMLRKSKIMQAQEALDFGLCHEVAEKLPLEQQDKDFGFGATPKRRRS